MILQFGDCVEAEYIKKAALALLVLQWPWLDQPRAGGWGGPLSLEGSLTCIEQLRVLGLRSCQASSRLHSDIPECSFHRSAQKAPSLSMPGGMGRTVTGGVCRESTPVRISLTPGQSSRSDSCTPNWPFPRWCERRHEGSLPGVSEGRAQGQLWGKWGRGAPALL